MFPRLSVIIPTLNEAATLPGLLEQLRRQGGVVVELLVADGGSRDDTTAQAEAGGATVVHAPKGRGAQMNAGARAASHSDLFFLHADSRLTDSGQLARAWIILQDHRRQQGHDRVAGHFKLRFVQQPPGGKRIFQFYEEKSALNRLECINGDQGCLLSHSFFKQLGGFDTSLPFLEDQKLAAQIFQKGCWITLPGILETSARRFQQEGLARRVILNALIMAFHAIEFQEFFEQAPSVYRRQDHSRRLHLAPFFRLVHQLNRSVGRGVAWRRWWRTGQYLRRSAWQIFFLMDLFGSRRLGWRKRHCLAFYDRFFPSGPQFFPFDLVATPLALLWFYITWAIFSRADD